MHLSSTRHTSNDLGWKSSKNLIFHWRKDWKCFISNGCLWYFQFWTRYRCFVKIQVQRNADYYLTKTILVSHFRVINFYSHTFFIVRRINLLCWKGERDYLKVKKELNTKRKDDNFSLLMRKFSSRWFILRWKFQFITSQNIIRN